MEEVRLVEDTALKAAGVNALAGSIPVSSVNMFYKYKALVKIVKTRKDPLAKFFWRYVMMEPFDDDWA